MPERLHRAVDERGIPQVRATDLFPELSDDIDRRIMHSETKIKLWVIGAVLANAMAIAIATVPSVYYLGQLSSKMESALGNLQATQKEVADRKVWMAQREKWEALIERRLDVEINMEPRPTVERR